MAMQTSGPKDNRRSQEPSIQKGLDAFYRAFQEGSIEFDKRKPGRPKGSGIKRTEEFLIALARLADGCKKAVAKDETGRTPNITTDGDLARLLKENCPEFFGSICPRTIQNLISKGRRLKSHK